MTRLRWIDAFRQPTRGALLGLAIAGMSVGCRPKESPPDFIRPADASKAERARNSDVTSSAPSKSNIAVEAKAKALATAIFRNGSEQGRLFLPETTGGGIAAFDFDRDGQTDVLVAGGGFPDVGTKQMRGYPGTLCRGLGQLEFADVSRAAHLDLSSIYNAGCAIGDYDGDGFSDVLLTGYSGLQLLRNQGDGTLEAIDCPSVGLTDSQWGASAAFFDANNDGWLDLYVAHYANWSFDFNPICSAPSTPGSTEVIADYCGPREFRGLTDVMYRNLGQGAFEDVSAAIGIDDTLRGLGVVASDLDLDGDVDVYVANDVDPNLLYRNDGDFRFVEVGRQSGVACNDGGIPEGSMGIGVGDYNLDGKLDLWVTNYQNELNALYRNNGKLSFAYASNFAKITNTDERSVGWGTAFVDMDLDGDEDLLVVNGHIEMRSVGSTFEQRPQILENLQGKSFQLVPRDGHYLSELQSSRGLAVADFNGDGLMDYAVSRLNTDAALVLNASTPQGRWLKIRLVGTASNRDAIGTTVQLQSGQRTWVRQRVGGGSYASSHDAVLHFGVPTDSVVDNASLSIAWPSGQKQRVPIADWNTEMLVIEGQ